MRFRKLAAVVLLFMLIAASGTALRIYTLETDKDEYAPGETVQISSTVFNNEEQPIADHQIELAIAYSPKFNPERAPDGETIREKTFIPLELTANERRIVNYTWTVPDQAAPGSYKIYFLIRNENEDIQVFTKERFNVSNVGQEVRALTTSDLVFHQGDAIGYSLEGLRVSSNESAEAIMNITNIGNVQLQLNVSMQMQYTYDRTRNAYTRYEGLTVAPNETQEVVFEFMPPDTPTTYTPTFRIHDSEGNFLGERKGRLVVRGNSGRILNAGIDDAAYEAGETLILTAELIGPADYSGAIRGATLNYTVTDEQGEILVGGREVTLSGQTTEIAVNHTVERAVVNPNVTMYLTNNGRIFDVYSVSYSGGELEDDGNNTLLIAGLVIAILIAGIAVWRYQQ